MKVYTPIPAYRYNTPQRYFKSTMLGVVIGIFMWSTLAVVIAAFG